MKATPWLQGLITILFIVSILGCTKKDDPPGGDSIIESPLFNETKPDEGPDISLNKNLDISGLLAKDTCGQDIVSIALNELGRGPENVGMDRSEYPYSISSYMPVDDPWCSEFVSWTYCAAGWPLDGGTYGGWMLNSHQKLLNWFSTHPGKAHWHQKGIDDWSAFIPKPGDYIRFIWSSSGNGHSGIVRAVDGSTLYTIEGNYSNKVKLRTIENWRTWEEINGIGTRNLEEIPELKGTAIKIISSQNGLALSSKNNSNYTYLEELSESENQLWYVSNVKYDYYTFENAATGLFLDANAGSSYLMAYDNNDEEDKYWRITDDGLGNINILNIYVYNYCIDVNNNDSGDYVRIFRNNYRADKYWRVITE